MIMIEEYVFAFIFGLLAWISSLQFAKLYPHNVKYGKYVLYLHSLCCILGIYELTLTIYGQTQDEHLDILLALAIPSHYQLFITNFIFFQWLKIYFSDGYTAEWLINFKWCAICSSVVSFIALLIPIMVLSIYNHLSNTIYKSILYTGGSYCILMSISFISVAHLLMRRVIKTANLSGQLQDPSVCRRLLGSGIVFSSAYLIQGAILYSSVIFDDGAAFKDHMRLIHSVFRGCIILILWNTLWLYSKIIRQRVILFKDYSPASNDSLEKMGARNEIMGFEHVVKEEAKEAEGAFASRHRGNCI